MTSQIESPSLIDWRLVLVKHYADSCNEVRENTSWSGTAQSLQGAATGPVGIFPQSTLTPARLLSIYEGSTSLNATRCGIFPLYSRILRGYLLLKK